MSCLKHAVAALALGLAITASAQTPAPAPAQQAPAGKTLSEQQKTALGAVWFYSQIHVGLGDVASSRGASEQVKKLTRDIQQKHNSTFAPQLTKLLQARGANPAALPPPPERDQVLEETKQITAKSGEEFDKAIIAFWKQRGPAFVDALKKAREATPGHDAELKKALDDAENSEEAYLTSMRQADSNRAQARTPPKK